MNTYTITKKDLDSRNHYTDSSNFDGHLIIEKDLGMVYFSGSLIVTGYIQAKSGSGITAGEGINAGCGITAGGGITAGRDYKIFAGTSPYMKNAHDVITCTEIVTGTMAHGKVNIIKKNPEQSSTCEGRIVEIDDKKYKLTLV